MWGLGGVCDEKGAFVPLSAYDGGWATHGGAYPFAEPEYKDDDVVYFGPFFSHWGHFLVDLIGRMWYIAKNGRMKVAYLGEQDPQGNFLEFFRLLGLEEADLVHVTEPTRFRRVIVPEYSCRSCVWYTNEYRLIFDAVLHSVEKSAGLNYDSYEKVYFSRLAFGEAKKKEVGEKQLADWLVANGYKTVSPEQLSLRQQVHIWNHATHIACLDGTIPLNVSFCKNKELRLLVIHKTHLEHKNLELALLMRPCEVVLLDAYCEPFKKYPVSIGAGPFLLCISKDVVMFSKMEDMYMPFSDLVRHVHLAVNYCRLVWRILDFKGKLHTAISRILPKQLKSRIRAVLNGLK